MNLGRGRTRRPDDWPSSHVRARADLSDRLDSPLEPTEANWLSSHLEACPDCRVIADAYAAQRLELRALRDRMPPPPRDLWARTSAAIESESRFRDGRARSTGWRNRRVLAPSAVISAALVVAVAVAALTSSQRFFGGGPTGTPPQVALGSGPSANAPGGSGPLATPIAVAKKIEYLARESGGTFSLKVKSIDQVCPDASTQPCSPNTQTEDHPVALSQDASTVFGSQNDERLIVVNDPSSANAGTISVIPIASVAPGSTPTPPASSTPASAPPSGGTTNPPPSRAPATPPPSGPPTGSGSPTPSVEVTPSPSGAIEIAHNVVLVGESAGYSPTGGWFAFTARPEDGSAGPDIFVWKVGELQANPVTTDHRSVFGSWMGDVMVGSTIVETTKGAGAAAKIELQPVSYLLDPATNSITALPQTGEAWRPAVEPRGRLAVYWAGTVRQTAAPGFAPDAGRLVLGDWGTGSTAPSGGPLPTSLKDDQAAARHETTITAGRMADWDARWDTTGTHLAIWIADDLNPAVGRLSLYKVDSFDGKIDLKTPLLDAKPAVAGYAISDGQLVWAEPAEVGSTTGGKIQLLAWTDEGVGTSGSVTGPVIVIR